MDSECKTPEGDRIPRDESFKTAKAVLARPNLRNTPVRISIASGGKPFHESNTSARQLRSRRTRAKQTPARKAPDSPDSVMSNGTFIRDSLEPENTNNEPNQPAITDNPIVQPVLEKRKSLDKPKPKPKAQPSPTKVIQKAKPSPKKVLQKAKPISSCMPPPPTARLLRTNTTTLRTSKMHTPQVSSSFFRRPETASRYQTSMNTSRLIRSQSYKSTAEIEREYFRSLRSFF